MAQTLPPTEVIVIDDGQLPDTFVATWSERFGARGISLTYHRKSPTRKGLTRSRNLALRTTCADVIFYLDDDARLTDQCLGYVRDTFAGDRDEAVAGVDLPIDERTRARRGRRMIERMYRLVGLWSILRRFHHARPVPSNLTKLGCVRQIRYLHGGAMAFRVRTLDEIGGFDENLTGHALGEDKDISIRLSSLGLLLRITSAVVYHAYEPGGRENPVRLGYETISNYLYINIKLYPVGVGEALLLGYTVCGLVLIELAFACLGDRSLHLHQLKGMVIALSDFVRGLLWSTSDGIARNVSRAAG